MPGRPDLTLFPRTDWLAASPARPGRPAGRRPRLRPAERPSRRCAARWPTTWAGLGEWSPRRSGSWCAPATTRRSACWPRALRAEGARSIAFEDPSLPECRRGGRGGRSGHGRRAGGRARHPRRRAGRLLAGPDRPAAVVVTPAHQFPLGVTLHPHRRAELVQLARATGTLVVEDDYDGEFRFDRQPVGALQAMAPDVVAYAGTASKTLAPGLRLAWLVLPERLVEPVGAAKFVADRHNSVLDQLTFAELLSAGHYDQHVRRCRDAVPAAQGQGARRVRRPHRTRPASRPGLHVVVLLAVAAEAAVLARAARRVAAGGGAGPVLAGGRSGRDRGRLRGAAGTRVRAGVARATGRRWLRVGSHPKCDAWPRPSGYSPVTWRRLPGNCQASADRGPEDP